MKESYCAAQFVQQHLLSQNPIFNRTRQWQLPQNFIPTKRKQFFWWCWILPIAMKCYITMKEKQKREREREKNKITIIQSFFSYFCSDCGFPILPLFNPQSSRSKHPCSECCVLSGKNNIKDNAEFK